MPEVKDCKPEESAIIRLRALQLLTALYELDNAQTRHMVKDIVEVLDVETIVKIMIQNARVVLQEQERQRLAHLSLEEQIEALMKQQQHREVSIFERLGYTAYIALARLEDYGVRSLRGVPCQDGARDINKYLSSARVTFLHRCSTWVTG